MVCPIWYTPIRLPTSSQKKQETTCIKTWKTNRYHPEGNGQVEQLNGAIWKTIQVTLCSCNIQLSNWENVRPDELYSVTSLLCTSTNTIPYDRQFKYSWKSTFESSIPSWTKPGPIYIRNYAKSSNHVPW